MSYQVPWQTVRARAVIQGSAQGAAVQIRLVVTLVDYALGFALAALDTMRLD